MDVRNAIHSTDEVGIGHGQWLAVITRGNGAVHIGCPGTEHHVGFNLGACNLAAEVELERLVTVTLEIIAQESTSCLAGIDDLQLVIQTLGIG